MTRRSRILAGECGCVSAEAHGVTGVGWGSNQAFRQLGHEQRQAPSPRKISLSGVLPATIAARRAPVERMVGPSDKDAAGQDRRESKRDQDNAQPTHGNSFRDGPRASHEAVVKLAYRETQRNGCVAFFHGTGPRRDRLPDSGMPVGGI